MRRRDGVPSAEEILRAVGGSARGPLKPKELARELGVGSAEYDALKAILAELEHTGRVYRVKGGRYALPEKINLVVGRLSLTRSGDGFVIPEEGEQDLYVPFGDLASAMDGDEVVARIEARPRGRNPVGRIIKVLERAHPKVVGTYRRGRRFGYVVPKEDVLPRDVLIPEGASAEPPTGTWWWYGSFPSGTGSSIRWERWRRCWGRSRRRASTSWRWSMAMASPPNSPRKCSSRRRRRHASRRPPPIRVVWTGAISSSSRSIPPTPRTTTTLSQ